MRKQVNERAPSKRLSANEILCVTTRVVTALQKSQTFFPDERRIEGKVGKSTKEKKSLQQQIRRKNKKVEKLSEIVWDLRDKKLLSDDSSKNLEQYFFSLSAEIIKNYFKNQNKATVGGRHSQMKRKDWP